MARRKAKILCKILESYDNISNTHRDFYAFLYRNSVPHHNKSSKWGCAIYTNVKSICKKLTSWNIAAKNTNNYLRE